jgi:hypothetical protein
MCNAAGSIGDVFVVNERGNKVRLSRSSFFLLPAHPVPFVADGHLLRHPLRLPLSRPARRRLDRRQDELPLDVDCRYNFQRRCDCHRLLLPRRDVRPPLSSSLPVISSLIPHCRRTATPPHSSAGAPSVSVPRPATTPSKLSKNV